MDPISLRGVTIGSPTAQDILAATIPELKPCPFCGNPTGFTVAQAKDRFDNTELQVKCNVCGAKGPTTAAKRYLATDWEIAARVWNDYPSTKLLPQ